ncbi:DNA (cytosine-5-)-methyltransferase [Thomasclavelia cocleata]|uniref:DNA (cytosine-5-)-methyltransferase n=1 Tax=Thomasclavelia cocleata TaxID=69824 RepID=UPI002586AA53|nr:DNA (cytosine-5-)-methyltransferase [Thomasclavelia cocleata]
MKKTAIELFAGVGGFRIGLNHVTLGADGKAIEENRFDFVWANQWEPSTKAQDAFDCYKFRFSKGNDDDEFSNEDISIVTKKNIPNFTLLTGGFPCQDYSVARSLSHEQGIEGKKGVLWWQINDILKVKKPPFVLLENVDRLLKSPSKQRGRDFGIMLRCFADNNYSVEWRIINAAEYGHPQKRRRVYIFAYKNNTNHAKSLIKIKPIEIFNEYGIFSKEFPINDCTSISSCNLKEYNDLLEISDAFKFKFENAGYMHKGVIYTTKVTPKYEKPIILNEIILHEKIDEKYFLSEVQKEKFNYLKGSKKIPRINKNTGFEYMYSEGAMTYPDLYENPGRTMLTSEGTINRSTHVVFDRLTGKLRLLTPVECERLNQFPDNWTSTMNDKRRYFMMGNALVTGIIKKLGNSISHYIDLED